MEISQQVTPSCRYGHGDLVHVQVDDQIDEFVMAESFRGNANFGGATFGFRVYVCSQCGYSELFDSDPKGTLVAVKEFKEYLSRQADELRDDIENESAGREDEP